jgi:hypothetical protein
MNRRGFLVAKASSAEAASSVGGRFTFGPNGSVVDSEAPKGDRFFPNPAQVVSFRCAKGHKWSKTVGWEGNVIYGSDEGGWCPLCREEMMAKFCGRVEIDKGAQP